LTLHSFESMAKQLVTAYKLGKIKAVGVSNFSKDEL
jgi:diketogulonate reductase-like aldo/keto reductase